MPGEVLAHMLALSLIMRYNNWVVETPVNLSTNAHL